MNHEIHERHEKKKRINKTEDSEGNEEEDRRFHAKVQRRKGRKQDRRNVKEMNMLKLR